MAPLPIASPDEESEFTMNTQSTLLSDVSSSVHVRFKFKDDMRTAKPSRRRRQSQTSGGQHISVPSSPHQVHQGNISSRKKDIRRSPSLADSPPRSERKPASVSTTKDVAVGKSKCFNADCEEGLANLASQSEAAATNSCSVSIFMSTPIPIQAGMSDISSLTSHERGYDIASAVAATAISIESRGERMRFPEAEAPSLSRRTNTTKSHRQCYRGRRARVFVEEKEVKKEHDQGYGKKINGGRKEARSVPLQDWTACSIIGDCNEHEGGEWQHHHRGLGTLMAMGGKMRKRGTEMLRCAEGGKEGGGQTSESKDPAKLHTSSSKGDEHGNAPRVLVHVLVAFDVIRDSVCNRK